MDQTTEIRLLIEIAQLRATLDRLYDAAYRVVSRANLPDHVTAKSYNALNTKRVPSRPLATLRTVVMDIAREKGNA